jgi:hypothetical protein
VVAIWSEFLRLTTQKPIANQPFIDEEYNRSFVLGQYFGYLRRNRDIPGFIFWRGRVNGAAYPILLNKISRHDPFKSGSV